jgi:hypothetical protein
MLVEPSRSNLVDGNDLIAETEVVLLVLLLPYHSRLFFHRLVKNDSLVKSGLLVGYDMLVNNGSLVKSSSLIINGLLDYNG